MFRRPAFALSLLLPLAALAAGASKVERLPFGTSDGRPVELYVLTDASGMVAKVATYGATLTELDVPDRHGGLDDVVLGFDRLDGYLGKEPYFGATVGRVGNRIAGGTFTLNGKTYHLFINDGGNSLHGGRRGFSRRVWTAAVVPGPAPAVKFSYHSPDGEEGYPGNLDAAVTYSIAHGNELRLDYAVTVDQDCPVNLTNHSYFNLAGPEHGTILNHLLMLNADAYTPVDAQLIPTGALQAVAGTPMDFRNPTAIGSRLNQVGRVGGYDHNYVIHGGGGRLALVARVYEPTTGRVMEVSSTEPGVQFYTGNFLDGSLTGKKGVAYPKYGGLALETQHFPDSIHHPNFPSSVIKAGTTYTSTTIYRFSAR